MTKTDLNDKLNSNGLTWQTVVLTVSLALISAAPPTILALSARDEARQAKVKTVETHDLVNSRLTEVLPLLVKGAADSATLKEKQGQELLKGAVAIEAAKTLQQPQEKK